MIKLINKLENALKRVCSYKSQISLVEIGRENLTNDIDNEVIPILKQLKERAASKKVIK